VKARRLASLALLLVGCGGEPMPLSASDVTILEPIPGQDRTVAYLRLENNGEAPVTLSRITSPQFRRVEMHATILDDGVAGMQALDAITIAESSGVAFEAGGRHLMLIDPSDQFEAGDTITLEFHYDQSRLLILNAPMRSRTQGDD
jgi:copper(I)-binding protein